MIGSCDPKWEELTSICWTSLFISFLLWNSVCCTSSAESSDCICEVVAGWDGGSVVCKRHAWIVV